MQCDGTQGSEVCSHAWLEELQHSIGEMAAWAQRYDGVHGVVMEKRSPERCRRMEEIWSGAWTWCSRGRDVQLWSKGAITAAGLRGVACSCWKLWQHREGGMDYDGLGLGRD